MRGACPVGRECTDGRGECVFGVEVFNWENGGLHDLGLLQVGVGDVPPHGTEHSGSWYLT